MKRYLLIFAVPAAIAASFLTGCSSEKAATDQTAQYSPTPADQAAQTRLISHSVSRTGTFTGKITDIDYANRDITLKNAQGQSETFSVSQDVKRFNEAKVGDKVSLDYFYGYTAEFRKPTAEEKANPLVVLQATGRTGAGEAPSGANMQQIRAVVTIEAVDRSAPSVTVKGPRGKYFSTLVENPSRLDQVHIGDTIVMTFTVAEAVSLKPAE